MKGKEIYSKLNEGAYEDGFSDGRRGRENPRASSIYGPSTNDYSRGYSDGRKQAKIDAEKSAADAAQAKTDRTASFADMSSEELETQWVEKLVDINKLSEFVRNDRLFPSYPSSMWKQSEAGQKAMSVLADAKARINEIKSKASDISSELRDRGALDSKKHNELVMKASDEVDGRDIRRNYNLDNWQDIVPTNESVNKDLDWLDEDNSGEQKLWMVKFIGDFWGGKYYETGIDSMFVLASSSEEAKQLAANNMDAVVDHFSNKVYHGGKRALRKGDTKVRLAGGDAKETDQRKYKKALTANGVQSVDLDATNEESVREAAVGFADIKVSMDRDDIDGETMNTLWIYNRSSFDSPPRQQGFDDTDNQYDEILKYAIKQAEREIRQTWYNWDHEPEKYTEHPIAMGADVFPDREMNARLEQDIIKALFSKWTIKSTGGSDPIMKMYPPKRTIFKKNDSAKKPGIMSKMKKKIFGEDENLSEDYAIKHVADELGLNMSKANKAKLNTRNLETAIEKFAPMSLEDYSEMSIADKKQVVELVKSGFKINDTRPVDESQLNEDLSNFTSVGIPAEIARGAIKNYDFAHDVKLEEVPKPKAKEVYDGAAYFVVNKNPEKSGFLIAGTYRSGSKFYRWVRSEGGEGVTGTEDSFAKAAKGMSGKVYRVQRGYIQRRQTTGGQSADSQNRDSLGQNVSLSQIQDYVKQAFSKGVDDRLAEYERTIKEAMMSLMDYPNADKYGDPNGKSFRNSKSAMDYANDMLGDIKAIRNGSMFSRDATEQFLVSIKKYSSGWGSHYTNQDNLLAALKEPNGRAKYVKSFLNNAEKTARNVTELLQSVEQASQQSEELDTISKLAGLK